MLHSGAFFLLNIDKSNKVVLNKISKSYAFWVIKDGLWEMETVIVTTRFYCPWDHESIYIIGSSQ